MNNSIKIHEPDCSFNRSCLVIHTPENPCRGYACNCKPQEVLCSVCEKVLVNDKCPDKCNIFKSQEAREECVHEGGDGEHKPLSVCIHCHKYFDKPLLSEPIEKQCKQTCEKVYIGQEDVNKPIEPIQEIKSEPETEDWEKEFDDTFFPKNKGLNEDGYGYIDMDGEEVHEFGEEIKAFITKVREEAVQKERSNQRKICFSDKKKVRAFVLEKAIEEIKNKRPNIPFPDDGFFSNNIKEFDKAIGYHKAVEDMIEILKKI